MIGEDGCPFCRRIKNEEYDHRYPADINSVDVVRFEPLNPVTPGHLLFVPVPHPHHRHMVTVAMHWAVDFADWAAEDYNLIINHGEHASQTIQHTHLHYVPRHEGDGLKLPWTDQVKA